MWRSHRTNRFSQPDKGTFCPEEIEIHSIKTLRFFVFLLFNLKVSPLLILLAAFEPEIEVVSGWYCLMEPKLHERMAFMILFNLGISFISKARLITFRKC